MYSESDNKEKVQVPLFGYFCIENGGQEEILVHSEPENRWAFPLNTTFDPCVQTVTEALNAVVTDFCESSGLLGAKDLLLTGLESPVMRKVLIGPSLGGMELPEEQQAGFFFKVKLSQFPAGTNADYEWLSKLTLFASPDRCADNMLLYAILRDYVHELFNFKVLECVDVLVFRRKEAKVEFLILKREDRQQGFWGWEYPKGGLRFHETVREGALRLLRTRTGNEQYAYRGYLGYQAVDVSDRRLPKYDTLRVHALTFEYLGTEEAIKPTDPKVILRTPRWVDWATASKMIWMKSYAPEFLERWLQKESQILAGQL